MGRHLESVCRLCRRERVKLFLKGERCYTAKCAIERRAYVPGQHGQQKKKFSPYAIRLREKQKLRRIYGLMESQFMRTFQKAEGMQGIAGENLLNLLERRLDNIVYRMGFASSRNQARQLVSHGHFLVNGKRTNIPSYTVRTGDKISLKEASRSLAVVQSNFETAREKHLPGWLSVDFEQKEGVVTNSPNRQDIDVAIQERFIVEFYSQ